MFLMDIGFLRGIPWRIAISRTVTEAMGRVVRIVGCVNETHRYWRRAGARPRQSGASSRTRRILWLTRNAETLALHHETTNLSLHLTLFSLWAASAQALASVVP